MDEKTLKDKLRELFENIKQKQWKWEPLITEKNGETILDHELCLESAIIDWWGKACDNGGMREHCEINEPVLCLVADILHLAFEFTQE
jgi:hypothetical protein